MTKTLYYLWNRQPPTYASLSTSTPHQMTSYLYSIPHPQNTMTILKGVSHCFWCRRKIHSSLSGKEKVFDRGIIHKLARQSEINGNEKLTS